jgi:hypothetical protein
VTDATTSWSWTAFSLDGGSIALGQNAPATPPNDLEVVVPAVAGSNSIGKLLDTLGQFSLAFDLRLDVPSLDNIPYVIIAQVIVAQTDGGSSSFNYSLGPGAVRALQVFVNGQQTSFTLPAPPTQQWIHVTLAYDPATGATATQDGVAIGGGAIAVAPGGGTLIVGDVYGTPPGDAFSYSMDDIVIQGSE